MDSTTTTPNRPTGHPERARHLVLRLDTDNPTCELLDRTLIWNQRQLERLLNDFVEHYNQHRPHRNLNQRAPTDDADASVIELGQPIQRTTTCAGLINEYRPAA